MVLLPLRLSSENSLEIQSKLNVTSSLIEKFKWTLILKSVCRDEDRDPVPKFSNVMSGASNLIYLETRWTRKLKDAVLSV